MLNYIGSSTTTRLKEIEKMEYILLHDNYSILYHKEELSNNVIFKKEEDLLWLRFQSNYVFNKKEFDYIEFHSHYRLSTPWKYFSLIFQTLWFKYDYTYKQKEYIYPIIYQQEYAIIYFVDMIWKKQSFINMKHVQNNSHILVIWQPQGDKSKVYVYLDINLSNLAKQVLQKNIPKIKFENKILIVKPYENNVKELGRILIKVIGYKF